MKIHAYIIAAAVLLAACSKEPGGEPSPESRSEIVPVAAFAPGGAPSKAVADPAQPMTLYFLRADQNASGAYATGYGATALSVSRAAGTGAKALTFSPTQYYLPNNKSTKMVGWYPQATSFSGGVVSWTLNGTQDILTAVKQEGSVLSAMPSFTFDHRLSQVQFWVYAENSSVQSLQGQVTAITVTGQRTACSYTPASAESTGAVAFSGTAGGVFTVQGLSSAVPPVGSASASQFGLPVMIEAQSASYTLNITVTTQLGGTFSASVPARTYPASSAVKIRVKVTAYGIMPAAPTITDWGTGYTAPSDVPI